jgi:hypothetical protein
VKLGEQDRQAVLRAVGEVATLDGREVRVIFRDGYQEIPFGDRVVAGRFISARLSDGDVGEAKRGSKLTFKGTRYVVEELQPDGRAGWTDAIIVAA